MTAAEMEQYVCSRWDSVNWGASNYELTQFGVILYDDEEGIGFRANSQASAWQSAYDFTIAREEKIRQVEKETEAITELFETYARRVRLALSGGLEGAESGLWDNWIFEAVRYAQRYARILAREQAALADLKRGMR